MGEIVSTTKIRKSISRIIIKHGIRISQNEMRQSELHEHELSFPQDKNDESNVLSRNFLLSFRSKQKSHLQPYKDLPNTLKKHHTRKFLVVQGDLEILKFFDGDQNYNYRSTQTNFRNRFFKEGEHSPLASQICKKRMEDQEISSPCRTRTPRYTRT